MEQVVNSFLHTMITAALLKSINSFQIIIKKRPPEFTKFNYKALPLQRAANEA